MLPPEYLGVVSRNSIVWKNEITGIRGVCEYRNAAILHGIVRETIIPVLKEIYPTMCERTISYVILRNIQPLPMKSLHYLYEKTYLSRIMDECMSPDSLSGMISLMRCRR